MKDEVQHVNEIYSKHDFYVKIGASNSMGSIKNVGDN